MPKRPYSSANRSGNRIKKRRDHYKRRRRDGQHPEHPTYTNAGGVQKLSEDDFNSFHGQPVAVSLLKEYCAALKPMRRKRYKPDPNTSNRTARPPVPPGIRQSCSRPHGSTTHTKRFKQIRLAGLPHRMRLKSLVAYQLPPFGESLFSRLGRVRAWKSFHKATVQRLLSRYNLKLGMPRNTSSRKFREMTMTYRVKKLTSVFSNSWSLAMKDLDYLRKQYVAAEAERGRVPATDAETVMAMEYGKCRYHVYSTEDAECRLSCEAYASFDKFKFGDTELIFVSDPPVGGEMQQSQEREVPEEVRDIAGGEVAEKPGAPIKDDTSHKDTLYRSCDDQCQLPKGWAARLHLFLSTLFGRDSLNVARTFLAWEDCRLCRQNICRFDASSCTDLVSILRYVAPHFCGIRTIIRRVYSVREKISCLLEIDEALYGADYETFADLCRRHNARVADDKLIGNVARPCENSSEDIERDFARQILNFNKCIRDFPIHPCAVCERLFESEKMKKYEDHHVPKKAAAIPIWNAVCRDISEAMGDHWEALICTVCESSIYNGKLPKFSRLNGMGVADDERFKDLNEIEKTLVQRVRCFQDIIKLRPLTRRFNPADGVPGLRGLSFFLPLPDATVCETMKNYSLPNLDNLTILVDCPPSKKHIIYRYAVDFSKVLDCLQLLRQINPLYANVELKPLDSLTGSSPFVAAASDEETEASQELFPGHTVAYPHKPGFNGAEAAVSESDDIGSQELFPGQAVSCLSDRSVQTVINDAELGRTSSVSVPLHAEESNAVPAGETSNESGETDVRSLLSRALDRNELSGYSLKRVDYNMPNETAVDLYKMGRVSSKPLFEQEPDLDCLCYPTLFPDGKYGMNYKRQEQVKLSEYIDARMNHKSGRFRKNMSYRFFCAQLKDMKALAQGVYVVMKVGPFHGMTAQQLRSAINVPEGHIQRRLTCLLQNIPGTREYCSYHLGTLMAMDEQLGPSTFFITLSPGESNWPELEEFLLLRNPEWSEHRPSSMFLADTASVTEHFHKRFQAFLKFVILDDGGQEGPLGKVEYYYYRIEYQARGAPHVHMKLWVRAAPVVGKDPPDMVVRFIDKYLTCAVPGEDDPEMKATVTRNQTHRHTSSCLRKKMAGGRIFSICRHAFPRPVRARTVLNDIGEVMRSRARSRKPLKLYELCRSGDEAFINDYNPVLLKIWGANMDIQYVGDQSRALDFYITCYISKHESAVTQDLYNSLESSRSAWSKLMSCGRSLLRNREMGSYEAFDRCKGVPIFRSSIPVVYIPTNMRGERMRRVKPLAELEGLNDDSEDIFCNNIVDTYYPNRPEIIEFEDMCLVDFVCRFTVVSEKRGGEVAQQRLIPLRNGLGFVRPRQKEVLYRSTRYNVDKTDDIEKYFHSLLLLFVPWRNEDDLLADHSSYRDAFLAKQEKFVAMAAADSRKELLRKSLDHAKRLVREAEEADAMAPGYVPADAVDVREALVAPVVEDPAAVQALVESLNDEQLRAFNAVMNSLAHEDDHISGNCACSEFHTVKLFISGNAGTGKSRVVDALRFAIQERYGGLLNHGNPADEPGHDDNAQQSVANGSPAKRSTIALRLPVVVSAPTGVASKNVQGVTAHMLLKLPVQHGRQATYKPLNPESLKELKLLLRDVRVLILDEVSMISNVTLLHINLRLREIKSSDADFGGIHVVFLGDLLQLRPVHGEFVFKRPTNQQVRANTGSLGVHDVWLECSYIELVANMRQREDLKFAELLNRARIGSLTEEDITELNERRVVVSQDGVVGTVSAVGDGSRCSVEEGADYFVSHVLTEIPNAICLLPLHESADRFNAQCMSKLEIETVKVFSHDTGSFSGGRRSRRRRLGSSAKEKASDTGGLEEVLTIGINARVMLRRNISQKEGYVNGSLGTVVGLNYESTRTGGRSISSVDVLFDDKTSPTTIGKIRASFQRPGFRTVTREQLPLCVAYAITIHKAQGLSLDSVMLDIGANCFEPAMAYVGLSRCKQLQNLFLLDFDARRVCCDENAVNEYNRLRRKFEPSIALIQTFNTRGTIRNLVAAQRLGTILCSEMEASSTSRDQGSRNVSNQITGVSRTSHSRLSVVWPFFTNSNNSCYMDALLQFLFACGSIWQHFNHPYVPMSALEAELRSVYLQYKHFSGTNQQSLSSERVRSSLGGTFGSGVQECVWSALSAMMDRLPVTYHHHFTCTKVQRMCCLACRSQMVIHDDPGWMVAPLVCVAKGRSITFTDFIRDVGTTDELCAQCRLRTDQQSFSTYEIHNSDHLLVHVPVYDELNHPIGMKIRGLTPNQQTIFGKKFRLAAAVEHIGSSTHNGHYVCWVRSTIDGFTWLRIDGLSRTVFGRNRLPAHLSKLTMLGFQRIEG